MVQPSSQRQRRSQKSKTAQQVAGGGAAAPNTPAVPGAQNLPGGQVPGAAGSGNVVNDSINSASQKLKKGLGGLLGGKGK